MVTADEIVMVDAWQEPTARAFVHNVWPLYLHDISAFDSDFYKLDAEGRWLPDIVGDWTARVTPADNLRVSRRDVDPGQPFQRTHVIVVSGLPVGFVCLGLQPFKYMPDDADVELAEFFLVHASRGTGTGRIALEMLLRRYPGRWHLRAIHDNARAIGFWRKVLPLVAVSDLEERAVENDITWRFTAGA